MGVGRGLTGVSPGPGEADTDGGGETGRKSSLRKDRSYVVTDGGPRRQLFGRAAAARLSTLRAVYTGVKIAGPQPGLKFIVKVGRVEVEWGTVRGGVGGGCGVDE